MLCYNGRYLTNEQKATCTPEQLKTCIVLNDWSEDNETGLFLYAPTGDKAPQGVRVNSSMYGFVAWAKAKSESAEGLNEEDVEKEYDRRLAMVNVRFSENYDSCPLNHPHYVTLVATKAFTGTEANPVELIADYDHDEEDGLPDRITQALEFCPGREKDDEYGVGLLLFF